MHWSLFSLFLLLVHLLPGSDNASPCTGSSADILASCVAVPLILSLSPPLSPEEFERLWLQQHAFPAEQGINQKLLRSENGLAIPVQAAKYFFLVCCGQVLRERRRDAYAWRNGSGAKQYLTVHHRASKLQCNWSTSRQWHSHRCIHFPGGSTYTHTHSMHILETRCTQL